ncbi:MAG: hypothetical protein OXQ90_09105 [Gammaproteobacteria bacterium]|nr:hypothetical protein [Gammaproteobacteria bacterium]
MGKPSVTGKLSEPLPGQATLAISFDDIPQPDRVWSDGFAAIEDSFAGHVSIAGDNGDGKCAQCRGAQEHRSQ